MNECMGVKAGMGKTKGTEHRITLNTPKREWELGAGEAPVSAEWVEVLQVIMPPHPPPHTPPCPALLPSCRAVSRLCPPPLFAPPVPPLPLSKKKARLTSLIFRRRSSLLPA